MPILRFQGQEMGPMFVSLIVLALAALIRVDGTYYEALAAHADINKFEPMVAFICGKPAMVRTPDGWQSDETTSCLHKPQDIIKYCKKKYPNEDIRNVVESSDFVTIGNWCAPGRKHCHHHGKHTVRPFRCFVGPFQSDALLVPQHCNFSHEHSSKTCFPFDHWNLTAQQKCYERGMHLQSFAMLQPCGLGVFSGVEYVCCPGVKKDSMPATNVKQRVEVEKPAGKPKEEKEKVDPYNDYLRRARDGKHNEHERFKAAEKEWQQRHHEKITKMMKEWATARKHVQELKSTDPRKAEKINKEITERFQKTYQAFEEEGAAMKKELVNIHQNRVQANLNEKKRTTMQMYLNALQASPLKIEDVTLSLEKYIRSEEKDRIHSINHYEHLRETDPEEANRILPQTQEHLRIIDQRVNQSLMMLKKLPVDFEQKILLQIKEFLKSYRSVDETIKHVLSQPVIIVEPKAHKPVPSTQAPPEIKKTENTIHKEPVHIDLHAQKPIVEVKAMPNKKPTPKYDPESMEDEHAYMKHEKKKPKYNHQSDDSINLEQSLSSKHDYSLMHTGSTAGIAIGSVAVFVIIIVAIVLLRKKAQNTPPNTGFVEVEQTASPEERHVANMQINGYENPTYKYFETNN